jgi:uncharacterized protein (DUF1015 family)
MRILPFPAVVPNLDKVPHSNDFFDTVKFRYHEYAAEGLFQNAYSEGEVSSAMYVYQIKSADGEKYTGLIACADINDYFNGNIKLHEKTIITNEDKQGNLLQVRKAAIKPVLLTYPEVEELQNFLENYTENNRKFYVIELAGEKHRFWKITEGGDLSRLQRFFDQYIPQTYLADGHHRSASFAALHRQSPSARTAKMLCAFFADTQLSIDSFHRVVRDLNGLTEDGFLDKLQGLFKIKVLSSYEVPYMKHEMIMRLGSRWYGLNWRKDVLKNFVEGDLVLLDVHLLAEKVLKPLLGITNVRTDKRLSYIEGTQPIASIEKAVGTEGVGFCLFPVGFDDFKAVVDSNGTMPPKSTFFQPRMKNGLVVYEIGG